MSGLRSLNQREWRYAWHYARYDRRHGQRSDFVGPALRQAAQFVMHGQSRDKLALREQIAKEPMCTARSAILYTVSDSLLRRVAS